jgi:hypothetical protein
MLGDSKVSSKKCENDSIMFSTQNLADSLDKITGHSSVTGLHMKCIRILALTLVVVQLFLEPSLSQTTPFSKAENKLPPELPGLNSALYANLQSVIRGDVLFSVSEVFDSVRFENQVQGLLVMHKVTYRFRFDFENEKYLLAVNTDRKTLDMNTEHEVPSETKNTSLNAFLLSDDKAFTRFNLGRLNEFPSRPYYDFIGRKIPDFRQIGILAFPSQLENEKLAILLERLNDLDNQAELVSTTDSTLKFKNVIKVAADPHFSLEAVTVFDVQKLVPVSKKIFGVQTEPEHVRGFVSEELYQWQEFDGVFVPLRLKALNPEQETTGDRKETAIQQVEVRFHWFSVNEPLEAHDFDSQLLNDNEQLLDLIDDAVLEKQVTDPR